MLEIHQTTAEEMRQIGSGTNGKVPLEQCHAWENFAEAMEQPLWRHLKWLDDGKPVAIAVFYEYEAGGIKYLWTRRGPVWLKDPSPEREAEALRVLADYVRANYRQAAFVRLHSWYAHPQLREPFRVVGYDRTVIIDGAKGDRAAAQANLPKSGRRVISRAQRRFTEAGGIIAEETGLTKKEFGEFYELLALTGKRDGFVPHQPAYYWTMLQSMGSDFARLFSARVNGELACWDLVGVCGKNATAFYGASSALSREVQAAPLLDFEVACRMAEEGRGGLDLMGIHSPRTPSLFDVGRYKLQFAENYTDVAGLWDLPLKPMVYRGIQTAVRGRKAVRALAERRGSASTDEA